MVSPINHLSRGAAVAAPAVLGAAAAWGVCAAVAARADYTGVAVAPLLDRVVGLMIGGLGALLAVAGGNRHRPGTGFAIALLLAGAAAFAFVGRPTGSWWVLAPFVAALGATLGLPGWRPRVVRAPAVAGTALIAAAAAVAAAAGWLPLVAAVGDPAAFVITALALLAAAVVAISRAVPPARTSPIGWILLPAAVLLLVAGAPRAVWTGGSARELVLFAAPLGAVVVAVAARSAWIALAMAALAMVPSLLPPQQGVLTRTSRRLAVAAAAAAIYCRATQELQLWCDGVLVDGEGPDRPQAPLVATLLGALLSPGDRVLQLGLGAGKLPPKLAVAGDFVVDLVDHRDAPLPLLERLAGVGPVAHSVTLLQPGQRRRIGGLCRVLAGLDDASRQAIVVGEPLHARSGEQAMALHQHELRRVAGDGIVVQPFAMDRTPPELLRRLLVAAAVAHRWNGVFAVGDAAVLLSAGAAPAWPTEASFSIRSRELAWLAHAAHLGGVADLRRACLGTVRAVAMAEQGAADQAGEARSEDRSAVLAVLHGLLVPPAAEPIATGDSVLLRWLAQRSELRALQREVERQSADAEAMASAQAAAARWLPIGAPAALWQAALALPDAAGARLRSPAAAALIAQAIDPTLKLQELPLFAELPAPLTDTGALEDLAGLPAPVRLLELCSGDTPLAIALRARFPSPCAGALLGALATAPLVSSAASALRELADPFVLSEAGRVLRARGAVTELFAYWRGDLPMPAALTALQAGSASERQLLVESLAGRRDPAAMDVLADSLVDADPALRRVAGAVLRATLGDRIDYDPEWPRSRQTTAAQQLRALHNRTP